MDFPLPGHQSLRLGNTIILMAIGVLYSLIAPEAPVNPENEGNTFWDLVLCSALYTQQRSSLSNYIHAVSIVLLCRWYFIRHTWRELAPGYWTHRLCFRERVSQWVQHIPIGIVLVLLARQQNKWNICRRFLYFQFESTIKLVNWT